MISNYTVSDFYKTFENSLKLLAGAGGMARIITNVGILDYEVDPVQMDKYFHTNFQENQMVVTTFSVAKDNPYLILDAIKYLISKGVCGLVIKNIFKLPIQETVIRYANSKNFPIFLVDSQELYVEAMMLEIYRQLFFINVLNESNKYANILLNSDPSPDEVQEYAFKINPSFSEMYRSIFVRRDEFAESDLPDKYYDTYLKSELNVPENAFLPYANGFFLILSDRFIDIEKYTKNILKNNKDVNCGISGRHSSLKELNTCLKESVYAASLPKDFSHVIYYSKIGSLQVIIPFAKRPEMQSFKSRVLDPILDYDIENNGSLMKTITAYINLNCDLPKTADVLAQHKNTIRYRLDKITALTGLDYKSFSDLEQLSLAIKINNVDVTKSNLL